MLTVAVHPGAELYGSDRMFLVGVAALDAPVMAVLPDEGPLASELDKRAIAYRIVRFPVLRRVELRTPVAALWFALRFLAAIPRLALWLRRRRAAAVYISTVTAPVWIIAGRLARCHVVCHVHENEPAMSRWTAGLLLSPVRLAHKVIANSEGTRRWIERSTSKRMTRRTIVVHNGVQEPEPLMIDGNDVLLKRKSLVVVGRLSHRKGQDVAIDAVANLRHRGYDVSLTLVGDCYPGYESLVRELKQQVLRLGLEHKVLFAGFQEPHSFVAHADIVLVPSRVESFGLAAAEALLLGRPTVASRVGGLPEVISDGITGRLVQPGDAAALADAVAELLDDPAGAADLGRQGQAEARRRFSPETYASRLREALTPAEASP